MNLQNIKEKYAEQPTKNHAAPFQVNVLSLSNWCGWKSLSLKKIIIWKMFSVILYSALCNSSVDFGVLTKVLVMLMIHNIYICKAYVWQNIIHIYCINVCMYMHQFWKPLHSVRLHSGYGPGFSFHLLGYSHLCAPVWTRYSSCGLHNVTPHFFQVMLG